MQNFIKEANDLLKLAEDKFGDDLPVVIVREYDDNEELIGTYNFDFKLYKQLVERNDWILSEVRYISHVLEHAIEYGHQYPISVGRKYSVGEEAAWWKDVMNDNLAGRKTIQVDVTVLPYF